MKRIFTFLLALFFFSFGKSFSQSCVSLQCAASHTGITTDGTLPDQSLANSTSGCFNPIVYKQIFWQFFLSNANANFTQTFTPDPTSPTLDLDWAVFDIGPVAPLSVNCPFDIDGSGWTEVKCASTFTPGTVTGPGTDGIAPTIAGDYYAVAIIVYQGLDNIPPGLASYTFDIGAPLLGGIALTAANCPAILLPVKLSSFGARVNNCIIDLNWSAASESDSKDYELQYSNDGSKFQTIATIAAASSNSMQNYSYQHANPQQGKIYYRLKMVDIDGKFEYSRTIAMRLDCNKSQIFVYPNPVKDILNINITNSRDNVTTAKLFDLNGKLIYSSNMISGTNAINMVKFAKGMYMLQLISNTETQNIKIIK